MKILVTGGAGFIGSNLVEGLLNQNHEIIVIDDFSLGKMENIEGFKNDIMIHKNSICNNIQQYLKDIEMVFHLAALPRVQYSIQNPEITHNVNVNGTLNLLLACKKANIKRFVFASSSSVYGNQETLPFRETMKPNPLSPYGLHKLIGEYYCKLFTDIYKLETVSLRYFNVYGPRQDPSGDYALLIPKFIKLVNENKRPVINGDGTQTRDFTYVTDVVDATIKAAFADNAIGEVINIATGKNYSVNEITKLIISDKNIKPIYGPPVIEPKNTLADIKKAEKILKWKPKTTLKEGIKLSFDFFSK